MKSPIYTSFLLILFTLLTSCSGFQLEEDIPYEFEFQEQVFITGLLTNEFGFVTLDIQKTIPADATGFNPVNDAQVALYMKEFTTSAAILVTESFTANDGRYTSSDEIAPIVGNIYWTEIVLPDGTTFKSKEEMLKPPITLTISDTDNANGNTEISFLDPIDEENFYLLYLESFEDGIVVADQWEIIDDINDESKILFAIKANEGVTVKVSLYHINFNTFQFYSNSLFQGDNEIDLFFSPLRNLYGNITNVTANKVALGNFGIAGLSSVSVEF